MKRKYTDEYGINGGGKVPLKYHKVTKNKKIPKGIGPSLKMMRKVATLRTPVSDFTNRPWSNLLLKYFQVNDKAKYNEVEELIVKNPDSKVVKMIRYAYRMGNPWLEKKMFIDKFFSDDISYSRFNKAKANENPDRPKITLGRSQSIVCFNKMCRVNPFHVFVYSKIAHVVNEANLLLDFAKQKQTHLGLVPLIHNN